MRRAVAIIAMWVVVASSMAMHIPDRTLPPCCKAHGCTMMKRAAHGCAFSRCDQSGPAQDLKQVPAVLALDSTSSEQSVTSFEPAASFEATLSTSDRIDHPPQLLPA